MAQPKAAGLVGGAGNTGIRQTEIAWIADTAAMAWIYKRLIRLTADAQRDGFGFILDGFEEDAQVARYLVNGHYDWHSDRGGAGVGQRRKVTVVVQLSPEADYTGGVLELNPAGHPFPAPRSQGSAIVFPSYVLHRVTPVTSGARYSLTQWIHGPDFV